MITEIIEHIKLFREKLYKLIYKRRDSAMDLIDALSSNRDAESVIQLNLNELFRRRYSSIGDAISNFFPDEKNSIVNPMIQVKTKEMQQKDLSCLVSEMIPLQTTRNYFLFGVDCTPISRQFADTLEDRYVTYEPNPVLGNKPITIGHSLSSLVHLPEKRINSWVLPVSGKRVLSSEKGAEVGLLQMNELLGEPGLPFSDKLTVVVGDTNYSTPGCQKIAKKQEENLILLTRARSNRNFYYPPEHVKTDGAGHPIWYGAPMKLPDEKTHHPPAHQEEIKRVTRKGKTFTIKISCWYDMLMRGHKDFATHEYPFTLVRVVATNTDGKNVYKKPLWLMVFGKKRMELQSADIYDNYCQRYDIEHFFRFAKQRLLLDAYQTPEVKHEEAWWQFVSLAYAQLYLCRELSEKLPNPWEVYLPNYKAPSECTPTQVLRDFNRLIKQKIGTPAKEPKPRGKAPGRKKGYQPPERTTKPVIFKTKPEKKSNKVITQEFEKSTLSTKPKSYDKILEKVTGLVKKNGMTMADFLKKVNSDLPLSG